MNHAVVTTAPEITLWIKRAAGFIVDMYLDRLARGGVSGVRSAIPQSFEEWILLSCCFHVEQIGVRADPEFEAVLLQCGGRWQILFNRAASICRQQQYICHELAEFIMVEYEAEFLVLDIPASIPREALRHEVALEVVRWCCPCKK